MIRELDGVSLAFSLWEQSRETLGSYEERLIALRKEPHTARDLDILEAEIAVLREKTDRLLREAIKVLREHAQLSSRSDAAGN
jgi:uncharacterized protein YueI